jgi:hypothetical protein
MEEVIVTRVWMAGIVAMMAIFAVVAAVGYIRKNNRQ